MDTQTVVEVGVKYFWSVDNLEHAARARGSKWFNDDWRAVLGVRYGSRRLFETRDGGTAFVLEYQSSRFDAPRYVVTAFDGANTDTAGDERLNGVKCFDNRRAALKWLTEQKTIQS